MESRFPSGIFATMRLGLSWCVVIGSMQGRVLAHDAGVLEGEVHDGGCGWWQICFAFAMFEVQLLWYLGVLEMYLTLSPSGL